MKNIYMVIVSSENIVCDRTLNCIDTNLYLYIFLDAIFFFSFSLFSPFRFVEYDTYAVIRMECYFVILILFFFFLHQYVYSSSFLHSQLFNCSFLPAKREHSATRLAGWLREIDNRIAYCTLELSERNTI